MRIFITILTVWMAFAAPATAQQSDIEGVIQSQINAFEADDFEKAFTFAAPTIRRIFRTPENFGMMVQRGYPMVHRPARVEFLELREVEGEQVQLVRIDDQGGRSHVLAYRMTKGTDGWQIAGVTLLAAPEVAA